MGPAAINKTASKLRPLVDASRVKWQSARMVIQSKSMNSRDDGMPGHLLPQVWHTGRFRLMLSRVHLMGIVNVTPDSFSDGGRFVEARAAIAHAERLVSEGADLLDLGAESTRLNATPVPAEEEWRRLQPVLAEVVRWNMPVSVDSHKPEVMRAALEAGADLINDVRALTTPGALQARRPA